MKILMLSVAVTAFAACAFAGDALPLRLEPLAVAPKLRAPQTRTVDVKTAVDGAFSLTYLHDGNEGYGGIAFTPSRANGKLSYGALAVTDMSGKSLYVGALAAYEVYRKGEWSATFDLGIKGLDLASLSFGPDPGRQLVIGFSLKGRL